MLLLANISNNNLVSLLPNLLKRFVGIYLEYIFFSRVTLSVTRTIKLILFAILRNDPPPPHHCPHSPHFLVSKGLNSGLCWTGLSVHLNMWKFPQSVARPVLMPDSHPMKYGHDETWHNTQVHGNFQDKKLRSRILINVNTVTQSR